MGAATNSAKSAVLSPPEHLFKAMVRRLLVLRDELPTSDSERDEIVDAAESDAIHFIAHRRRILLKLLVHRGKFSNAQGEMLLLGPDSNERRDLECYASMWLRCELSNLRSAASSPVRTHGLLSRLQIADLAIAMLDYNGDEPSVPTPELIELLAALLDVDRHRSASKKTAPFNEKFALAAEIEAQAAHNNAKLTVRELARRASVSIGTISAWRKLEQYRRAVQFFVQRISAG
jgi:hypothetical protein